MRMTVRAFGQGGWQDRLRVAQDVRLVVSVGGVVEDGVAEQRAPSNRCSSSTAGTPRDRPPVSLERD